MFRFTIRDVLWLMVVVGLGLGWWADKRMARDKNSALREALNAALSASGSRSITLRDGEFVDGFKEGGINHGDLEITINKIEPKP